MPFIGKLSGGVTFTDKFIPLFSEYATKEKDAAGNAIMASAETLKTLAEAKTHGAVFAWGNFVTVGINFLIVAFVMFLVVKAINKLKKAEAAAPAATPAQEVLLTEIRDLLKK
jgi:large conductance mechanosensitive channel